MIKSRQRSATQLETHRGVAHLGNQLRLLLPVIGAQAASSPVVSPVLHVRLQSSGTGPRGGMQQNSGKHGVRLLC